MRVSQLIEKLEGFDDDTEVCVGIKLDVCGKEVNYSSELVVGEDSDINIVWLDSIKTVVVTPSCVTDLRSPRDLKRIREREQ